MRITLASVIFLAGLSPAAHADDLLAGGFVFGTPEVGCTFYNAGNTAVTIRGAKIVNLFGQQQTLSQNTCNDQPSLAPGQGCLLADNSTDATGLYACRAFFAPSKANVRGSIFILNASGVTVAILELR